MKKAAYFGLLFVVIFSALTPAFSQKSRRVRPVAPPVALEDEFARFGRIDALTTGDDVLIRWQMDLEIRTAGYQVYRLESTGYELVNTEAMIPGSIVNSRHPTVHGGEYDTWDINGGINSTYIIECRSLYGGVIRTNPFGVRFATGTAEGDPIINGPVQHNGDLRSRAPVPSAELQGIVQANMRVPDPETHRWVVGQPGAKIAVRKDGFYRVTRAQLETAGFNVNSPSDKWRLFMEGNEQAILVGAGDQYIEFHGKAIDTVESDTRMYYLIADVNSGLRMQTRILQSLGGNVISRNHRVTAEKRERTQYNGLIKNGDLENYYGQHPITNVPPTSSQQIKFNLSDIDLSVPTAAVTIMLQGLRGGNSHVVNAVLNGNAIGTLVGTGDVRYQAELQVNTAFLVEGENSLALTESNGGTASLFDRVTVNYARFYQAEQDSIFYATPGYRIINVTNFSTPDVRVFETTFDGVPLVITGHTVHLDGLTYTVRIPSSRPMLMNIVTDATLLTSPSVTANAPSNLFSETNSADMIFLSHSSPEFVAAANTWASYRQSITGGSFHTKVVNIDDVFDEFNYGVSSADAVNAFLRRAYEAWQTPRPQYVLLLGDGSHDPRNYEGFGYLNQVPTKILNLLFEESGSDDWLADFNNDGLSEMAVGRIATQTPISVTTALNKTISFEATAGQGFSRGGVFAYDLGTTYDFFGMSLQMSNQIAALIPITLVSRGLPPPNQNTPDPEANARLMAALNAGPFVANYSGHGSSGTWANSFFNNTHVPLLTNADRLTIYTMLTCLNGYFLRPREDQSSISERLIRHAGGGAVVTWSSTADTTPDFQLIMGTRFYLKLGQRTIPRMGDLVRDAKTVLPGNSDVRLSWLLMGDPALKVVATGP